jgi:hypothetical protein
MFLDPRYAGVPEQRRCPQTVGVGCLSTSLSDTLFDGSSRAFFEAAGCGLQCKAMQIVPARGR